MIQLTDEVLNATLEEYNKQGHSETKAASVLGISRSTLHNRLARATSRGIALGHPQPTGMVISGTTTLYKDGETVLEWVRSKNDAVLEDVVDALTDTFDKYQGMAMGVPAPSESIGSLLTVYPIADLHFGMYSWKEETGADYDLDIAGELLLNSMGELISQSPSAETAVILNLGDFYHSDSNENRTRRSGNALDVDTRYAKVLRNGVDLLVSTIGMALHKHKHVIVRNIPGNHDPYAALALTIALDAYYRNEPRVTIDTDPGPFWFMRFGRVLLGATHGDMAKPADMVGIMAAKQAVAWGKSLYRYLYLGHIHQKQKGGQSGGAYWETFETLAPKDAWGNSMGFVSGRSMQAITHHRDSGEYLRVTVPVKGEVK